MKEILIKTTHRDTIEIPIDGTTATIVLSHRRPVSDELQNWQLYEIQQDGDAVPVEWILQKLKSMPIVQDAQRNETRARAKRST